MTEAEKNERFVHRKTFTLLGYTYSTRNSLKENKDFDDIAIVNTSHNATLLRFPRELPNSEKTMIVDSIATDTRWFTMLRKIRHIQFTEHLIETIRTLQKEGLSGPEATTLTVYFDYGFAAIRTNESALDLYRQFKTTIKESALSNCNESDALRLYSEVYIHLSPELADRLLKNTTSLSELKRLQQNVFKSVWSDDCIQYMTKISPTALRFTLEFTVDSIQDEDAWIIDVLKIVSELSDDQIAAASKLIESFKVSNGTYNKRYNLFLSHATTRLSPLSQLPRVAALMLVRYDEKTLSTADDILNRSFEVDDLSIDKLIRVCHFLDRGGNITTPVHWMVQF